MPLITGGSQIRESVHGRSGRGREGVGGRVRISCGSRSFAQHVDNTRAHTPAHTPVPELTTHNDPKHMTFLQATPPPTHQTLKGLR